MKQVCRRYCWGRCCRWGSRPSLRCEQGGTSVGKGEAGSRKVLLGEVLLPPMLQCETSASIWEAGMKQA